MSPYICLKPIVLHVLSDSSLFLFEGLGSWMSLSNLIVLFPLLQIFDCPVSSSWRTAPILSFPPQASLTAEWCFRPPWPHPFCGVVFLTLWVKLASSWIISSVGHSSQTHSFCLIFLSQWDSLPVDCRPQWLLHCLSTQRKGGYLFNFSLKCGVWERPGFS